LILIAAMNPATNEEAKLVPVEDNTEEFLHADAIQKRALVEAARDGNCDIVNALLDKKIYPDVVVNQSTALNQAVLNSHADVVEALLKHKANIDKPDAGGQHPLMKCARSGKEKLCTILLTAKAEPNAADSYGQTALHKAARHGHNNICTMLIDNKANLNISETVHGHTPVMFAAIKNSKSTIRILLDAKADATVSNYVRTSVCATLAFPLTLDHLLMVCVMLTMSLIYSSRKDTLPNRWRVPKVITH